MADTTALMTTQGLAEALNAIGQVVLSPSPPTVVLDGIVQLVARALNVPFCKVLGLLPQEGHFVLRAGVGWQPGTVGDATVSAGPETLAGYTLLAGETVIVTNVQHTKRFRGPTILQQHGLTSGMSVPILENGDALGVISVHTIEPRRFTSAEANFLERVAASLGPTLRRMADTPATGANPVRAGALPTEPGP